MGGPDTAGLMAALSMGSRVRAVLKPRFAMAAAVLAAFALGAYISGKLVEPIARTSRTAPDSVIRIHRQLNSPFHSRFKSRHSLKPKPTRRAPATSSSAAASPPASTPSRRPTSTPTVPAPPPVTSVRAGSVSCDYNPDTWSGDATDAGYSVKKTRASNGRLASFAVVLNARKGNTEVVGYPSDQCLLYSALPSTLKSSFDVTPPADNSGLDYEYAFDIWITTAAAATGFNWDNDLELMIWTYVNGQVPIGSAVATLSDGSKVWASSNKKTGTVSVVLPKNETIGRVDIASVIRQLKARGYIPSADTGILDVEFGIEAPYGGGQTFEVNGLSVTTRS